MMADELAGGAEASSPSTSVASGGSSSAAASGSAPSPSTPEGGSGGAAAPTSGEAGAAASTLTPPTEGMAPGSFTSFPTSVEATGFGPCEGTTVGAIVATIQEQYPELADITVFEPSGAAVVEGRDGTDPQSSFYEVALHDETVEVSFRRCTGEVVDDQCSDSSYWFFETDATCEPLMVGRYRQTLDGDCFQVEGEARGPFRGFVDERQRCDFDPMAVDVSGTYGYLALSSGTICGAAIESGAPVSIEVTQQPPDLASATVEVTGIGDCIDGVALRGSVYGAIVEVEAILDLPASDECDAGATLSLRVALDGTAIFAQSFSGYMAVERSCERGDVHFFAP